jgi:hypothetical protein
MSQDSPQGRLLGPYSCLSTFRQFFVIGQGIGNRNVILCSFSTEPENKIVQFFNTVAT